MPSGHDTHSLELEPYKLVVAVAAVVAVVVVVAAVVAVAAVVVVAAVVAVVVVAAAVAVVVAVADPLYIRQISGIQIQELLFHSFWGQDNLRCSQKLRDYYLDTFSR
ncbi:hypothetical protein Tco_0223774 [Tanacetum coccineum]